MDKMHTEASICFSGDFSKNTVCTKQVHTRIRLKIQRKLWIGCDHGFFFYILFRIVVELVFSD